MPPRLTTAILTRSLAAAGMSALTVFGALPAAADPTDGPTPAQTDDVFRPSTAIFQPAKCAAGKQNVGVTLTNGSGAAATFLITSQGGVVSPASATVPANQSMTLTLHASGSRQSIFVSTKGKSAGSMPLSGCTAASATSTASHSASTRMTSPTSAAASATSASSSTSSRGGTSTSSSSSDSTGTRSTDASGSTTPSSSAGATTPTASAALPSPSSNTSVSTASNGPSPLMVTGGIVLAALGLMGGGVALFREFRR